MSLSDKILIVRDVQVAIFHHLAHCDLREFFVV
jgi:hypothetical protein